MKQIFFDKSKQIKVNLKNEEKAHSFSVNTLGLFAKHPKKQKIALYPISRNYTFED